MDPDLNQIYQAVVQGDIANTQEYVKRALASSIKVDDILQKSLIPAMDEVGALFERDQYFIPEMLVAAQAMRAALTILRPMLIDSNVKPKGRVVIGTVKGDLHDIGKNLVGIMLEGAGFYINDLGTNVSPEVFITAIKDNDVDIVALSALLTTTTPSMQETIQTIAKAGLRENVKIIVGGAPVTSEYAEAIGADGYAPDASKAVSLVRKLTE